MKNMFIGSPLFLKIFLKWIQSNIVADFDAVS